VRFGLHVPNHSEYADAAVLVDLASVAERAGWDGFFVWDHIWRVDNAPAVDPWIALAAIAASTERIALGALVTPLARRRPWKVARETVSLDRLSRGRLIIGIGLGIPPDYAPFGEQWDPPALGDRLDESLSLLDAFWSEQPISFSGRHYRVGPFEDEAGERIPVAFTPGPARGEAIPIWAAARPDSPPRTLRRASRLAGIVPIGARYRAGAGVTPEQMAEIVTRIQSFGVDEEFEIVRIGDSRRDPPSAYGDRVEELCGRRPTWWLDELHPELMTLDEARRHLAGGPPAA
jgi:alkanesulfonate monooxygenase SsuD/methylene tetrahydromethanopterin reductase-like flavin-dependent oxidoreductase (luciferase family)